MRLTTTRSPSAYSRPGRLRCEPSSKRRTKAKASRAMSKRSSSADLATEERARRVRAAASAKLRLRRGVVRLASAPGAGRGMSTPGTPLRKTRSDVPCTHSSKTPRGRRETSNLEEEAEEASPGPVGTGENGTKQEALDAADATLADPTASAEPRDQAVHDEAGRPDDRRRDNGDSRGADLSRSAYSLPFDSSTGSCAYASLSQIGPNHPRWCWHRNRFRALGARSIRISTPIGRKMAYLLPLVSVNRPPSAEEQPRAAPLYRVRARRFSGRRRPLPSR